MIHITKLLGNQNESDQELLEKGVYTPPLDHNGEMLYLNYITLEPDKEATFSFEENENEVALYFMSGIGEIVVGLGKEAIEKGDRVIIEAESVYKIRNTGLVEMSFSQIGYSLI